MTGDLLWTRRADDYWHASGREGHEYMVLRADGVDPPWIAMTTAGREPRKEHSLIAAQRLCQAWEDAFEMADELLMAGNVELAQRLGYREPLRDI